MTDAYIADLTVNEFRELVRDVVRQTLDELLQDPDAGLQLRPGLGDELRASFAAVESGAETKSAEQVSAELGLEW